MPNRFTISDFLIVLAAGLFASIAALLIALPLSGADTVTANLAFLVVLPSQLGGSLLALAWVRSRRGFAGFAQAYGLSAKGSDLRFLALGAGLNVGISLALVPVTQALGIEESPQAVAETVQELSGVLVVLAAAIVTVVLVPLVEELTYRGLLLRLVLQRGGEWMAVIVSSLVFSLVHLGGLDSYDRDAVVAFAATAFPALLVLGIVMARSTVRHGRLGPAIFTHAGFDLLSFVLLIAAPTLLE